MTRGVRSPAVEAHVVKIVLAPHMPQTATDASTPAILQKIERQAQREIEKAGLSMSKRHRVRVYKFGDTTTPIFNVTLDNGRLLA